MSGFGVEPGQLIRAAADLKSAAGEIERFSDERDLWLEAGRRVGSDRVQRSLAVFCEYWTLALRSLFDDSTLLAGRLNAAAETYEDTDRSVVP